MNLALKLLTNLFALHQIMSRTYCQIMCPSLLHSELILTLSSFTCPPSFLLSFLPISSSSFLFLHTPSHLLVLICADLLIIFFTPLLSFLFSSLSLNFHFITTLYFLLLSFHLHLLSPVTSLLLPYPLSSVSFVYMNSFPPSVSPFRPPSPALSFPFSFTSFLCHRLSLH